MIEIDKLYHFLAGMLICLIFGTYHPLIGLGVSVLAGIGKEVYDHYHPAEHSVEMMDVVATSVGGMVGFIVLVVM